MLVGLVLGSALGVLTNVVAAKDAAWLQNVVTYGTEPLGKLFLRLLFMLVVPLIVSSLVLGIVSLGDLRRVGRIGVQTLAYTVIVSSIAVLIGVGLVNLLQPGAQLSASGIAQTLRAPSQALAPPPSAIEFFLNLVPQNPIRAIADGDMLAVMVFSVFFAIGMVSTPIPAVQRLGEWFEGIYAVTMRLLAFVLQLAPLGVACLLFTATARLGYELLVSLSAYVGVVLLGLSLQQFGVYAASVAWLGNMRPLHFYCAIRPAMLTAFSTASSNATLPTSLLVAEENLKLPPHIGRFVLTLGSTANQNGTALFEGVTVLFLAQVYGIDLAFSQQLMVVAICILGGIGTAGVPAGSIPVVAMILAMVGVPAEGIGIVLGVDRLLDMCRTTVNVTGDLAAATVVARMQGDTHQP